MFGRRSDGIKLKNIDPIVRMTTFIMPKRYDAMVNYKLTANCKNMDEYIKSKASEGIKLTYMHVVIASIIRMYALRPELNRFVMNGNVYGRKSIEIAFAIKKALRDGAEETTVKLEFTGKENIFEIKQKIDEIVYENKGTGKSNGTDKAAKFLLKLPTFALKAAMSFIRFCDRHGMIPKKILKVSPFHTSCFLTNMKSISTDYVYHHIYDFGTCGLFASIGKERIKPVVNPETNEIEKAKILNIGCVIDERICDGLYYAKSIKLIKKCLENPEILEESLSELPLDCGLKLKKKKKSQLTSN